MLSDISSGFINRFNNGEFKSAGGRTELFESYNEYFLDNPQYWLTGTGVAYYKDICKQSNSMHNGTQQIYINTGKYETSELGKKLLQDVKIEDVKNTKEYFKNLIIELMRSVVCPLLVALVTAYLTTKYLK